VNSENKIETNGTILCGCCGQPLRLYIQGTDWRQKDFAATGGFLCSTCDTRGCEMEGRTLDAREHARIAKEVRRVSE
jgi:hypothetical protein